MQIQQLETTDIFKSAVFLCSGGSVQVNALELRQTLNHLRDVLFTRSREQKGDKKR